MRWFLNMKLRSMLWYGGGLIFSYLVVQILIQIYNEVIFGGEITLLDESSFRYKIKENESIPDVEDPIVLWWTPFIGHRGLLRECGSVKCFFTEDRRFKDHILTKAIMFYGSNIDLIDLPLPRNGLVHDWALLHEESPKNVPALSHPEALALFNLTATFSRHSHFPITLQYLKNEDTLTDIKFFVPLEEKEQLLSELAPVVYIHSDCSTPLTRDEYAQELMKYIKIDSYGKCLQNKKLPEQLSDPMEAMDAEEFLHFVARYKFTLTFENAICEDYITEKLWRPLSVGSVPIYMGSSSIQDWLPNKNSAVIATDFESPKDLADFIHLLNKNNTMYKSFLKHKLGKENERITNHKLLHALQSRAWGIDNDFEKGNFIEHFECFVCEQQHKKISGDYSKLSPVSQDHYNCPVPISPLTGKEDPKNNWWVDQWYTGRCEARVLKRLIEKNITGFTHKEFYDILKNMFMNKTC